MKRLEWFFSLIDRASAPARRVNAALGATQKALKSVDGASRATQRALAESFGLSERAAGRLAEALGRLGAAGSAIGGATARARALGSSLASIPGRVFTLPNLIIGGALGLAAKTFVDQIGFVEQQRIALSTMLKSPIRGEAVLEWAIKFADATPFETTDVLSSTRLALAMGFNTRQIEGLLTTLGDVASGTGSGLNDLVMIFGRMRASGRLATQDIDQLAERGVGAWDYLARGLGKSTGEIRKMVELGQIDSATGLSLITAGMRRDFGGMMEVQSRSIFGLVSTLRSRSQAIAFRLDKSRALEPFRSVLSNLVALSDFSKPPGSTIGQRLEAGLGGLFKAAFGPLATATEPKAAGARIEEFLNRATAMVERVKKAWPGIRAAALDFVAGVWAGFEALSAIWERVQPVLGVLSRLTGGLEGTKAGLGNTEGAALRLLGTIAALAAAWRVLNLVTLGGAGTLARWGAAATVVATRSLARMGAKGFARTAARSTLVMDVLTDPRGRLPALRDHLARLWSSLRALGGRAFTAVARVSVLRLSTVWAGIRTLTTLGLTALRASAQALLAGGRMAVAWMIGLGPIGWVIAGIAAVGTALAALYTRSEGFRNAVNRIWKAVAAAAQKAWDEIVTLFSSLPERIVDAVRGAGSAFVTGLRNIIRSAPGGDLLLRGLDAAGSVVRGAADFGNRVGGAVVGAAKNALGVRSPSREFAYLGRMSALGLAAGMTALAPVVERAGLGLAQRAIPAVGVEAQVPTLRPPAGQRSVVINLGAINVQAGPNQQPERIAEAVREAAVEAILSALERAAMEEGA